ncbi:MAG: hypothetical protein ACOYMC_15060 [Pirellulales bacterium]
MTRFKSLTVPILAAFLPRLSTPFMVAMVAMEVAVVLSCLGCKSDLSQQLLERELRMQEDQIYQLQDELQDKCARLDRTAGENTSLKKQLGFVEGDGRGPVRGPTLPPPLPKPGLGQPILAPPTIDVPGIRSPAAGPMMPPPGSLPAPGTVAPPKLDGIPPLPVEPRFPGAAAPGPSSVTPASAAVAASGDPTAAAPSRVAVDAAAQPIARWTDPTADPPTGRQLSHEESLADAGRITHLIVNQARTACFDGDGDGISDGLAIVVEPRDGDERLVTAAGDVSISVFDPGGPTGAAPVAHWDIPAREAIGHFRRTSRNRGLHFVLRWPGSPPQGDHVRVQVALTTFEAAAFQTDCTVAAKPQRQPIDAP